MSGKGNGRAGGDGSRGGRKGRGARRGAAGGRAWAWLAAAMAAWVWAAPAGAGFYAVYEIPVVPGTTAAYPNDLNDYGQVVGGSVAISAGGQWLYQRAFIYDHGTQSTQSLEAVLGSGDSTAYGVSSSGHVCGRVEDAWGTHAWVYQGGSVTYLGNLGYPNTEAMGVNAYGEVVGRGSVSTPFVVVPFEWDGVIQPLTIFPGIDNGNAMAINNGGEITGSAYAEVTGPGGTPMWVMSAYRYSGGAATNLGHLGGYHSFGYDINDLGQVAGASVAGGAGHEQYPCYWDDTGIHGIGVGSGDTGRATGINDYGVVVGTAGSRAFVWDGTTVADLNDEVDPSFSGVLGAAYAVNADGDIACTGWNASGVPTGYLLIRQTQGVGTSGSWSNAGTWVGGILPDPLDPVDIGGDGGMSLDVEGPDMDTQVYGVDLGPDCSLQMQPGAGLSTLGGFNVQGGGQLKGAAGAWLGGPLVNNGLVTGADGSDWFELMGQVGGGGAFEKNILISGALTPGTSPAKMMFEDLKLTGTTTMEIYGPAPGWEHDQFEVSGTAELGGTLTVALEGGYLPPVDHPFELIVTTGMGALVGDFSGVSVTGLPTGAAWDWAPGTFTVRVIPEPATLGLAAAGSAGVFAGRKRR